MIYGAGRPLVFAAQATSPGGKADIFDGSPETIRAIGGGAGFDGFEEDARQVVRRPTYSFDGVKSLAVATVEAAQRRPVARADFDRAYIDYRGPAGTIRTIPFWKLLPAAGRDRVSSAAFFDKACSSARRPHGLATSFKRGGAWVRTCPGSSCRPTRCTPSTTTCH